MSLATSVDIATLASRLAEANAAYHALMTGQAAVEIAVDGATFVTKFARPDADRLLNYIIRLEGQIRSASMAGITPRGPGAIGILFT